MPLLLDIDTLDLVVPLPLPIPPQLAPFLTQIIDTRKRPFSSLDLNDRLHPRPLPAAPTLALAKQTMPKAATDKVSKTKADAPKRKSKKDVDPNKPKRALSAYMFFVQDFRDRIKEENPGVTFGQVGKLLGAKWQEMSPAEKKPYEDKAEQDKTRAANAKKEYEAGGGGKTKKVKAPEPEEDDDDDEDDE